MLSKDNRLSHILPEILFLQFMGFLHDLSSSVVGHISLLPKFKPQSEGGCFIFHFINITSAELLAPLAQKWPRTATLTRFKRRNMCHSCLLFVGSSKASLPESSYYLLRCGGVLTKTLKSELKIFLSIVSRKTLSRSSTGVALVKKLKLLQLVCCQYW